MFQHDLVAVIATILGIGSGVCIILGLIMVTSSPIGRRQMRYWRDRWGLDGAIDDAILRDALQTLSRIRAWSLLFVGIGFAAVAVAWGIIATHFTGELALISMAHGWAITLSALIVVLVLGSSGQAYGLHRLRMQQRGQPLFSELRPRRVGDFVPDWLGKAFGGVILFMLAVPVVALPFLGSTLRSQLATSMFITLPFGRWSLIAIPLSTLLLVGIGRGLIAWTVALPNLKIGENVQQSAVFDVLFRRESVRAIVLQGIQLCFFFAIEQWALLLDNVPRGIGSAVLGIMLIAILLGYVGLSLGVSRYYSQRLMRNAWHDGVVAS
jgi:uncharacterized membrane protein